MTFFTLEEFLTLSGTSQEIVNERILPSDVFSVAPKAFAGARSSVPVFITSASALEASTAVLCGKKKIQPSG